MAARRKTHADKGGAYGAATARAAEIAALRVEVDKMRREVENFSAHCQVLARETFDAEARAKFWRDSFDACRMRELRYRDTIIGMGHQLADLKLELCDVDADALDARPVAPETAPEKAAA